MRILVSDLISMVIRNSLQTFKSDNSSLLLIPPEISPVQSSSTSSHPQFSPYTSPNDEIGAHPLPLPYVRSTSTISIPVREMKNFFHFTFSFSSARPVEEAFSSSPSYFNPLLFSPSSTPSPVCVLVSFVEKAPLRYVSRNSSLFYVR